MRAPETAPPSSVQEAFERAIARDAPLAEQLGAFAEAFSHVRLQLSAAYETLVTRLEALKAGSAAPQPGEPMPDFVLPDQEGRLTTLAELLAKGRLVVSFNRGHWCPFCRLEARALAKALPAIEALGGTLISIVPERAQYSNEFRRENGLRFPVLSDIDLSYTLTVGLIIWLGEQLQRLYADAGIDLALYNGGNASFLPVPATFVIGQDGLVKARWVDPDFRRRMPIEDVLAALSGCREVAPPRA